MIKQAIDTFLATLNGIVASLGSMAKSLVSIAIPVGIVLLAADIIVGTNFGVATRTLSILSKVGITGNLLTVIVCVSLYLGSHKQQG